MLRPQDKHSQARRNADDDGDDDDDNEYDGDDGGGCGQHVNQQTME